MSPAQSFYSSVMLAALALALPAAAARIKGDVAQPANGLVNLGDLAVVIRALSDPTILDAEQLAAADVAPQPETLGGPHGDGFLDLSDVLLMTRHVLLRLDVDRDGIFEPIASTGTPSTNPFDADTDGDGLCDGGDVLQGTVVVCRGELALGTSPLDTDSDGDGICDGYDDVVPAPEGCSGGELTLGTSPSHADSDGDGLDDNVEDPGFDGQGPGETSAINPDSDGDGLCDGDAKQAWDINGNELCAGSEVLEGTQALNPDSDGDGIGDQEEALAQVDCPNCFAVVVVPDTQNYVSVYRNSQPQWNPARHLEQVMEYICHHYQNGWREPSTKKHMPIEMVVHLGDLIANDSGYQTGVPGPPQEWQDLDKVFDVLDACDAPYLMVPGNHDVEGQGDILLQSLRSYSLNMAAPCDPADGSLACNDTAPFNDPTQAVVRQAWQTHDCADPPNCNPGEWFVGNGDDVAVGPSDEPGRHRVGLIQAPNGDPKMLFVGLDWWFRVGDSWIQDLLTTRYDDVPTLLFHHGAFINGGGGPLDQAAWDWLVTQHRQVFMAMNGHYVTYPANDVEPNDAGEGVHLLLRNFQEVGPSGALIEGYGDGWQVVMVFDPDPDADPITPGGEIRVRSYRISDVEEYRTKFVQTHLSSSAAIDRTHAEGHELQETWLLDTDWACEIVPAACETTLQWDFESAPD